jgi:large subunit ribosomal protein L9
MKVILLQDVKNVGKKFQEAEVANGYGTNYLIPNGLAQVATDETRSRYKAQQEAAEVERRGEREELATALQKIEGGSITIKVANVGDQGQLFAGIYPKDIAQALNDEYSVGVTASDIERTQPISKVGEEEIEIKILEEAIPFTVIVEQGTAAESIDQDIDEEDLEDEDYNLSDDEAGEDFNDERDSE